MLERRTAAALLGLALVAISARPAGAQPVSWKVAVFGPPRPATASIEFLAKEVAARTGGQIKIEPVYAEALSKATEMLDGLKAEAFEAALLCASYYPGKLPVFTVLDLAMLTPDNIMAQARVQMALAEHPVMQQELKRWGIRMLLPTPLPQYQMMGKKRITRVEDFKGVRIRVSGEMAKVLEDFGAVKSLVPAPETYTALERGVVDMITFPGTYGFASFRLHEISRYYIDKISLGTQPCFWAVTEGAWGKLPAGHQKLMLDLREPAARAAMQAFAAADGKDYPEFKARGIEVINFPPAERAKLAANAGKHWQEWVADKERRGIPARQVLEFVHAKIKEYAR
ncbi:MAG: TRAP transporter substrate-binding protein DctP [Candidatus Rokubacteria bacterium]|nr:TRAP transporter substrate-binding protein DctP [Candidatus Rokubacteria bacterium]